MTERNYYQVLGIDRNASPGELRAAFVRLARRHHPDSVGTIDRLPHRLQEIQRAYRCLSDPDRRAEHDRLLDQHDRMHFARQRAVRQRLRRYDRRHPRRPPRARRGLAPRSLVILAAGLALVACLSLGLSG